MGNIQLFPREKKRIYECVRKIFQKYHEFRSLRKSSQSQFTSESSEQGRCLQVLPLSTLQSILSRAKFHGEYLFTFLSTFYQPLFLDCHEPVGVDLADKDTLRQESEVLHFPFRISCSKRTQMKKGPKEKPDLKWWFSLLAAGMWVDSTQGRYAWHLPWVLCYVKLVTFFV